MLHDCFLRFNRLFNEVLREALIEREGDRRACLQRDSHNVLPFPREGFHRSFYSGKDICEDEGGREGGLGDFDCQAVPVVAVEVRALLRGDDTFAHGGHGGGIAREEAADFKRYWMLLLGEKCFTQRLAQEGEDAVIDEEEIEGCVLRGGGEGRESMEAVREGRTRRGSFFF